MTPRTAAEFRNAIRRVQALYSIPEILSRTLTLMREPDVDLERLGALVSQDAALVADVIRIGNSAEFSRGGTCVDLQLALQRLGLDEVIRIIELSLSKNVFGKPLTHYGLTTGQYWRCSLLAALLMEELAFIHGVDAPEAYTVGILHALGRVLIDTVLGDENPSGPRAVWDRSIPLENWEVSRVGFTSAEAGGLLLREWGFPAAIVNPVENQLGTPQVVPAHSPTGMLRLVRLILTADPEAGTAPQPAAFPPDLLGWAGFASVREILEMLGEAQEKLRGIADSLALSAEQVPEGL